MLLPSGFGNLITTGFAASAMRRNAEHHMRLLYAGIACQVAGFALLALWARTGTIAFVVTGMITIGAGFGFITQIGGIVAPNGLGPENIGTASGLNTFIRSLGQVLGTALIAGAILNGVRPHIVFLVTTAFSGIGFATIGRSRRHLNA
jgi:MFS family permease